MHFCKDFKGPVLKHIFSLTFTLKLTLFIVKAAPIWTFVFKGRQKLKGNTAFLIRRDLSTEKQKSSVSCTQHKLHS